MDHQLARDLLENLLERALLSTDKVFLTRREVDALDALLSGSATETSSSSRQAPVAVLPPANIVIQAAEKATRALAPVIVGAGDVAPDIMLCIDFGTSFSKAFVSKGSNDSDLELVDLAIGDGSAGSRLTTPSELFIDGERIYFGSAARLRWHDVQAPADRLIDSIKQFITLNQDVSSLGQRSMLAAQDPKQLFSQRDILALYLAHLTALTEAAIEAKKLPGNIRRRFTHPAWKDGSKEKNEREMRRLMAEAIVLARSAAEEFKASISTADARQLLDQLQSRELALLPTALIGEPVREATAAGAGALLATKEGRREAYLVLDIGAGTTDVAGFYCVNNPDSERMRVFEVSPAADAKNVAGNTLDNALQRLVMDRSGLSLDSAEARLAGHALRPQIRAFKEQLFRNGRVAVDLATDQVVEVTLEEFMDFPPVVGFNKIITDLVVRCAEALAGDLDRVNLVATGGGAGLPVVLELGRTGARLADRHIGFNLIPAMAKDVRDGYPDLVDPYPQIAVSLGGSLPQLPEQRGNLPSGITAAPKRTLAPMYRS